MSHAGNCFAKCVFLSLLFFKSSETQAFLEYIYWKITKGFSSTISFFFKYKFIYFNWRLITLQYCIGFAIHQHVSATGIHVFPILNRFPPPSLYHPSGSSQSTSPEHPVSCIEPGLVILFLYNIIHVSMSFSQICLGTKFKSLELIIVLSLKTLALKLQSQCSQFLVV